MVWYFIGVYVINRTLHGRLETYEISVLVVKKIFHFISPCGHVISSIYVVFEKLITLSTLGTWTDWLII